MSEMDTRRRADALLPAKPKQRLTRRELERRRMLLRTFGAGCAALGLPGLSAGIPVAQAIVQPVAPTRRDRRKTSSWRPASSAASACRSARSQAIKLADGDEGYGLGVPYIDARAQACDFSCDAVQCVLACPTGALSHDHCHKGRGAHGHRPAGAARCLPRRERAKASRGWRAVPIFKGLHRYDDIDRWKPVQRRRPSL